MLEAHDIDCPYCGERFAMTVDCSAGSQCYIEDCQVCCRPIEVTTEVENHALVTVAVRRDDD